MKRLAAALFCLCLIATSAVAFWQSRDSNYNVAISGGGGGGPSIASLFAATALVSGPITVPSVTFSAGVAVFGVAQDRGGGSIGAVTGVIAGPTGSPVSATQIGTTVSDGSNNGVSFWYAPVTAGTGSVVVVGGTAAPQAINGWMITGNSSNTPVSPEQTNGFAVQVPDPQTVTLTGLASGSVAISVIGRNFPSSPTQNPTTWTGVARDANAEAASAAGNGIIIAGGYASGLSGTVTVDATAQSGESWQYSGMLAAAWR